jgi:hypothetical protein
VALKDSLNDSAQTFTLNPEQVQFLAHVNKFLQSQLDVIQQHFAASFLNYVATNEFKYAPGSDLRFNFDPTKQEDNLVITEVTEP